MVHLKEVHNQKLAVPVCIDDSYRKLSLTPIFYNTLEMKILLFEIETNQVIFLFR